MGTTLIKDPVERVDMEGYSVAEAAEILSCAPGTIKSRCARVRARLLPLLIQLKAKANS